jgi:hypothetical protein
MHSKGYLELVLLAWQALAPDRHRHHHHTHGGEARAL